MFRVLLLSLFAISFAACSVAPLSKDQREITFVENTTLKKADAYNQALAYLAKNLGDSNHAIKVRDPENGTIITEISVECKDMGDFMGMYRYDAVYNLEFNAKDQRARIVYEAFGIHGRGRIDGKDYGTAPVTQASQMADAKKCATVHKTELIQAISSSAKKSSDW